MKRTTSETILNTANQQERFEILTVLCDKKGFKEKLHYFLAGFFEGEGSLWVSVNFSKAQKFGVQLNFGFSVYQHQTNRSFLELFKFFFKTGRIEMKSGSDSVCQFVINDRQTLNTKVRDFVLKYSSIFGSKKDYLTFFDVLNAVEEKKHLSSLGLEGLVIKIYTMSSLKGKKRKRSLAEVLKVISKNVEIQKSSETIR